MLSKREIDLARSIDRARRTSKDPMYLLGVHTVAHALADDVCTGQTRLHFLLACGVPFVL